MLSFQFLWDNCTRIATCLYEVLFSFTIYLRHDNTCVPNVPILCVRWGDYTQVVDEYCIFLGFNFNLKENKLQVSNKIYNENLDSFLANNRWRVVKQNGITILQFIYNSVCHADLQKKNVINWTIAFLKFINTFIFLIFIVTIRQIRKKVFLEKTNFLLSWKEVQKRSRIFLLKVDV